MRQRCSNPNNDYYKDYGARGIRVCERWDRSFVAFFEDMGERPTPTHSIERLKNDGDYEKDNCVWATPVAQANNRRNTVRYPIGAEMLTARELFRRATNGIKLKTLRARLDHGWTAQSAITSSVA